MARHPALPTLLYVSERSLGTQAAAERFTANGFAVTHSHSPDDAATAMCHLMPDVVLLETRPEQLHDACRSKLRELTSTFLLVRGHVEPLPFDAALRFTEILYALASLRKSVAPETRLQDGIEVLVTSVADGQMLLRLESQLPADADGRPHSLFRLLAMLFRAPLHRHRLDLTREKLRLDVPVPPRTTTGRSLRILLVDDHEDSRELFREHLELHGYDAVAAEDGRDALALLATRSFDVALLDISLPGLDGLEVARRTRLQLGSGPPMLVAITGHARDSDRDASHVAGFDFHLTKPVDVRTVMSLIESSWQRVDNGCT